MIVLSGRVPDYYFVVFGDNPNLPSVVGGIYPLIRFRLISGLGVSAGDVLLLYQNLQADGIGVVTSTETGGEKEIIKFQYFPLCHPISWVSEADVKNDLGVKGPFYFRGNWVQSITGHSYRAVISGRQLDWPV